MLVCLISTLACRFSYLTSETEVIVEEVVFGEFPKETAEEVRAKYYMPEKDKGINARKKEGASGPQMLTFQCTFQQIAIHSVLTLSIVNENEPAAEEDGVADD